MEHVGKHVYLGPRLVRVAYAGPRLGLMDLLTREVVEVERAAFEAWAAEAGVELGGPAERFPRLGLDLGDGRPGFAVTGAGE